MPNSGNHYFVVRVADVIHNPVISNPDSIRRLVQFLGIRAARVFADLFEFLNDPLTKHSLHAGQLFVCACHDSTFVTSHDVLNVHHVRLVHNGKMWGARRRIVETLAQLFHILLRLDQVHFRMAAVKTANR